ncbi:hypothetical protein ILUMI_26577 [Ignelater luminosus]|uniref:Major facilitator superfamily (MFS) profile domain-containing protein n=1 Tax=Ignelater luminosus TaxID=2038154 RepID=A0A8K0C9J0_IGNLU|nr:hypothetical protein ILUMI_26577 [Ignelater luminosus]
MSKLKESNSTALYSSNQQGKKLPQYTAALSVCMGALSAGTVLGWTGNISEEMKASPYNGIKIDEDILGWIGSLATLGATASCFPIAKLCDLIGRKFAMLSLTVPFMVGWLLIIFASNLAMLYVGRFLTGMAGLAFCVSAPIYTTEIAEKDIRGTLGSYFELLLCTGIAVAYAIAMIVDIKTYTIIVAMLPLVFASTFIFQPESPVYLLKCNKEKEARNALIRLRGKAYNVDGEIQEIKNSIADETNYNISILESLKKKGTQKAFFICFSIMIFQQGAGINAVVFYTDTIFKSAGSTLDPKLCTLIIGLIQAVATFISSMVVDKLGRRILLISSSLFVTISGVSLGVFFTLQERELVSESVISSLGFLPITSLSIFIIMYAFGISPIPWLLPAELFPPEVKSVGGGGASTINWFIAFLITKFYLNLKNSIGGDTTFYIFSLVALLGTIFIYFFVPETKGKTLDEIQKELNGIDNTKIEKK